MESLVSEKIHAQSALAIQDATTEVDGAWIGMKGALKMRALIRIESAAAAPIVTLQEAQDGSGTGVVDLERKLPAFVKVDGSSAVEKAEDGSAQLTVTELNGAAGYVMVEVEGQDLSEGFSHFRIQVDGAAARNVCATYEADTEYKPAIDQDL
jgi:hypothetical protein